MPATPGPGLTGAARSPVIARGPRRNRAVLLGTLLLIIGASWAYLLSGAGMAGGMEGMMIPAAPDWDLAHAAAIFAMWAVMMAAMMLPSATPMVLFYASISNTRLARGEGGNSPANFVAGYIAVWTAFSLAATALQFGLESASMLSAGMAATSVFLTGGVMIGTGLYQWSPWKRACLERCRSPLEFVLTNWREGSGGAFIMGLRHGAYCLGCCWMLMLLLFAGGVMNLAWIAGLTLVVLIEKLAPFGHWSRRITGLLLITWGTYVILMPGLRA